MPEEKLSFKQKLLYGLIFAVIGTVVQYLILYISDNEYNFNWFIFNFIIFWTFGFFIVKKRKKIK